MATRTTRRVAAESCRVGSGSPRPESGRRRALSQCAGMRSPSSLEGSNATSMHGPGRLRHDGAEPRPSGGSLTALRRCGREGSLRRARATTWPADAWRPRATVLSDRGIPWARGLFVRAYSDETGRGPPRHAVAIPGRPGSTTERDRRWWQRTWASSSPAGEVAMPPGAGPTPKPTRGQGLIYGSRADSRRAALVPPGNVVVGAYCH